MTSDEPEAAPAGAWVSTVRVSNELVRSNAVPQLRAWAASLGEALSADELAGATLAMRQMDHIVATSEGAAVVSAEMEDYVEVVEYDPVRHVAMVIGKRDAPRSMPLVWLMLRVFPGAEGAVVLPGLKGTEVRELRMTPRGSFDEAFAVGEAMAGSGREAVLGPAAATFERVGTVLVVPPRGEPAAVLELMDRGD